jgi:Domain of unknown function (DUF1918)
MSGRSTPGPATRIPARPGDRLVIHAHHEGEPQRDAEILAVLGPDGTPPYRVHWQDDGRESILYPGSDAHVEHLTSRRRG